MYIKQHAARDATPQHCRAGKARWLLMAAAIGVTLASADSASAAYILKYNTTTRGAITFTGNTLGLSRASGTAGFTAPGTEDSIGVFSTIDTGQQVGTYPAGTVSAWQNNSSAAVLVLPAGSTVLHAELVWSATINTGGQDITAFINSSVSFTPPNAAGPAFIAPTTQQQALGHYVNSADVTALVQDAGAGTYVVGAVPGVDGDDNLNNAAGWTLEVAYANPGMNVRNLTLFVGAQNGGNAPAQASGLCTPPSGALNGRIAVTAIEGDNETGGDQFEFGPTAATVTPLSGPNNPLTNFFASQMNKDDGTLDTSGTFGNRNHAPVTLTNLSGGRQSWDITNVDVSSHLTNNQASAFAQGTTTGDQYTIVGLGTQIDVLAPYFPEQVKSASAASAVVGDTLTYTINVHNTGGAAADNVVFDDPIPAGTAYVPGSLTVNGIAQADPATPVTDVSLGTIAAGASVPVTFRVTVTSVPADGIVHNTANWNYDFLPCGNTPAISGHTDTNEVDTPVSILADPQIAKSGPASAPPGGPISYVLTISNAGPGAADGTSYNDPVPAGVSVLGATCGNAQGDAVCASPTVAGNTVSGTVPTLPSGGSVQITITGTAPPGPAQMLVNTATVTAPTGTTDSNPNNNSATASTSTPVLLQRFEVD